MKKGRGETAPTFLIIAYQPVPVHPWSKVQSDEAFASGESFSAHSNANEETYRRPMCSKQVPNHFEGCEQHDRRSTTSAVCRRLGNRPRPNLPPALAGGSNPGDHP